MEERKELLKRTWVAEEKIEVLQKKKKEAEDMRSVRLQVDAELRKKKEAAEEDRIEVQKEWAVHHSFLLSHPIHELYATQ